MQRVLQQGACHRTRARGGDSDSAGLATRGGGARGAAGGWGELTKGTKGRIMDLSGQMAGSLLVLKYAGSTGSQVTCVPL